MHRCTSPWLESPGNGFCCTDFKAFSCMYNWSACPQGDISQPFCLAEGEVLLQWLSIWDLVGRDGWC